MRHFLSSSIASNRRGIASATETTYNESIQQHLHPAWPDHRTIPTIQSMPSPVVYCFPMPKHASRRQHRNRREGCCFHPCRVADCPQREEEIMPTQVVSCTAAWPSRTAGILVGYFKRRKRGVTTSFTTTQSAFGRSSRGRGRATSSCP